MDLIRFAIQRRVVTRFVVCSLLLRLLFDGMSPGWSSGRDLGERIVTTIAGTGNEIDNGR